MQCRMFCNSLSQAATQEQSNIEKLRTIVVAVNRGVSSCTLLLGVKTVYFYTTSSIV